MYHLLWIMPLGCLLLVLLAAGGLYVYHEQTHREVRSLIAEGEALALDQQLPEGLARIEQALVRQPEHPVLLEHRSLLLDAIALEEQVADAREMIEQEQYDAAATAIAEIRQQLQRRSGPIYEPLLASLQSLDTEHMIANTKAELASQTTMSELLLLMNRLRAYESEEAETLKDEIRHKAAELAKQEADQLTAAHNYPSALSMVDEALALAPDHEELTALRAAIAEAQAEYEAAAAEQIRDALEEAKKGQPDTPANPVEIVEMDVWLDDSGGFHIQGALRNNASQTLPSLMLHYEIYDQTDQLLERHTMTTSPQSLEPGAAGGFEAYHEEGAAMYRAVITRVEWGE